MQQHFVKIGADGAQLTADAKDHVAVLDTRTNLMWSVVPVKGNGLTYMKAKARCAELDIAGSQDWHLPEVEELFALCDRSRFNPAIDTDAFPRIKGDWFWANTLDASEPSSCAWSVNLGDGNAYIYSQYSRGRVLACRRAAPPRQ